MTSTPSLTYIGHATVLIEIDGVRLLTDPILRDRLGHLRRLEPVPNRAWAGAIDAVLISHMHWDHLDLPSLRRLGTDIRLIVPSGAARALLRWGFRNIDELRPEESVTVGSLNIEATYALHSGFRPPFGPAAECLGFIVSGSRRLYFAGDTDLFPQMAALGGDLDVALLPVWGWGPYLGPGHLNPRRAAEALTLLRPTIAVPIHWGTLSPIGMRWTKREFLTAPPRVFARLAAQVAPAVQVRVLAPGESMLMPTRCR